MAVVRFLFLIICMHSCWHSGAQEKENWHGKVRKIHYVPDGNGFLLKNGSRKFNRALYGTNSGFRVETGDLPEFALYMPGMGGNLKLGLINGKQGKWVTEATQISTRYSKGTMSYTVQDPILNGGKLLLEVIALSGSEGFMLKAKGENVPNEVQLLWSYGGASGKKFHRDGDIGADPESVFYLHPAYCTNNVYTLNKSHFRLKYGSENNKKKTGNDRRLIGIHPPSKVHLANANKQSSPISLNASKSDSLPVIVGTLEHIGSDPLYWMLAPKMEGVPTDQETLSKIFEDSKKATHTLADRVRIHTPDPYLNTLGSALSLAADAIWEDPAYLHGAVAWRMHLNAWRGASVADPLGWHDRAQTHFNSYANSQVISPPSGPVVFDSTRNLARQKEEIGTSMFSSGYISRHPNKNTVAHHYDMNLVFFDQMLDHFKWTGDTSFMERMWPTIQRHLAWEKRNFDVDGDGLYDAYASIWASDALQYSGGGVIHSSAYNLKAHKMAAEIAVILNKDPQPHILEAEKVAKAIEKQLWIPEKGIYAEYRDALGERSLHESPGLWSIYHPIDEGVPDPFQKYQMLQYVKTAIPHIPISAEGLEKKDLYMVSTTNWQPYTWSINNVALAEQLHTALAHWQGGQPETAFKLWESALVESMYLGASPGGFQQLSFYDAIRGELYRDFADPIAMTARSLVEGLYGIMPNALNDTLTIRPGLPATWDVSSLDIPDISFQFKRTGIRDSYTISPRFKQKMALKFVVDAPYEQVASILLNGKNIQWHLEPSAIGLPKLLIEAPYNEIYCLEIEWKGQPLERPMTEHEYAIGSPLEIRPLKSRILELYDPQSVLKSVEKIEDALLGHTQAMGDRTFFVKLGQGDMEWWHPITISVVPKLQIGSPKMESDKLLFDLRNNTHLPLSGKLSVSGQGAEPLQDIHIEKKDNNRVSIPLKYLVPGTNHLQISTTKGEVHHLSFTYWDIPLKSERTLEMLPLTKIFNAKVTDIFKNVYSSPRPQSPTLQLPTQGIGNWCYPTITAHIEDSGLRKKSGNKGHILTPQGIPLATPSDSGANNILFTSLWDNYPDTATIPLDGSASHIYLMMAGTTNPMQSRFVNGIVTVTYTDGSSEELSLRNPENWWPVEQDYFVDGYAFTTDAPKPPRVYLKLGDITREFSDFTPIKGFSDFGIDGGAATILDLPLNPQKTLQKMEVRTLANDVVIGLMGATLIR